jgi:hypothetical protein
VLALRDGALLLTFWCHEGGQSVIRWMRLEGIRAARAAAAHSTDEARLAAR